MKNSLRTPKHRTDMMRFAILMGSDQITSNWRTIHLKHGNSLFYAVRIEDLNIVCGAPEGANDPASFPVLRQAGVHPQSFMLAPGS